MIFEVIPVQGYKMPCNELSGKMLPDCCDYHKSVYNAAKKHYSKKEHSHIADKIVKQLSYTEYLISDRIDNKDWYNDITDYLYYNVLSFGSHAIGLDIYFKSLKHYITHTVKPVYDFKSDALLKFIELFNTKNDSIIPKLYSMFDEWQQSFPFDISFLFHLKDEIEPYYKRVHHSAINKYLGKLVNKPYSEYDFSCVLNLLTIDIIRQVNTCVLNKKGLLTNPEKIRIELAESLIEISLLKDYQTESLIDSPRYIDTLKEWIGKQREHIDLVINSTATAKSKPVMKKSPDRDERIIVFKDNDIIEKLHNELKGYFPNKESELLRVLKGEQLTEMLLFPFQQNQVAELFKRLYDNQHIINPKTEIKEWICSTFQYQSKSNSTPCSFNPNTIWNTLSKGLNEPSKTKLICVTDWLPYEKKQKYK